MELFSRTSKTASPHSADPTPEDVTRLHKQCLHLVANNHALAAEGPEDDPESALYLKLSAPHGGGACMLVMRYNPGPEFSLFPQLSLRPGTQSVIDFDGSFRQSGEITFADAERVIAAYVPGHPSELNDLTA